MTEFKPTSQELEEAKELAKEGVKRAKKELSKEEPVKIGFGWTEDKFVKENMGGVSGLGYSSTYFEISFNTSIDDWEENLIGSTVHEYGHAYFNEKTGKDSQSERPIWLYILEEALTQNLTEKLAPEASEPWRKEHDTDEIAKYWNKIKQKDLERNYNYPDHLFVDREGEKYPNWLGYSLSYRLGQKILEEYELGEFPKLEKSDVIRAGDKLFGKK